VRALFTVGCRVTKAYWMHSSRGRRATQGGKAVSAISQQRRATQQQLVLEQQQQEV